MKPSFDFTSAVSDERDARGGWCKGAYTCVCKTCGSSYFGDKRSYSCADCAYSTTPTTPSSEGWAIPADILAVASDSARLAIAQEIFPGYRLGMPLLPKPPSEIKP